MAPVLELQKLSCGYGSRSILKDVSFSLEAGHVMVLLGPNGAGKTTLFKTILGFLPRIAGTVLIENEDIAHWQRRRLAQTVAYVPQTHNDSFGFAVRDMVLMGRTPSIDGFRTPSQEDEGIVDEVLEALGLSALSDRDCTTLSGGELQMVLVARALAQGPRLLLMDEPCANLDLANQALLLQRVSRLARDGLAILLTSHDPNHALLLESQVVCITRQGSVHTGWASELLSTSFLSDLYGCEVCVGDIEDTYGNPVRVCASSLKAGNEED